MKKLIVILTVYLTVALFTNSYCRAHRWADWNKEYLECCEGNNRKARAHMEANLDTSIATMFWPVYWASRGMDEVVRMKVCVE